MMIDLSKYKSLSGDYDLAAALNSEPHESFIKTHAYLDGQNGEKHKYVRVSVCRQILDLLFPMRWSWKINTTGENMHGTDYIVTGTITIQTKDGFIRTIDGIGADAYQVNKKTGAVQQNAVILSAPKAEAAAFKNAAKKLGRIFGSELDVRDQVDFLGAALEKEKPKEEITRSHQNWDELCVIASTGKTSKGREIAGGVKAFLSKYQFASLEDLEYLFALEEARKSELVPITPKLDEAASVEWALKVKNQNTSTDRIKIISSKAEADKKVWASIYNSVKTGRTSKGNIATVDGILEHYAFSDADLAHLLALEASRKAKASPSR